MKWLRIRRWLVQHLGGETYWLDDEIEEIERGWQEAFWEAQNQRLDGLYNINNAIFMLEPDTSQFETMLMSIKSSFTPPGIKISWLEDELFPRLAPDPDVWFDGVWVDA